MGYVPYVEDKQTFIVLEQFPNESACVCVESVCILLQTECSQLVVVRETLEQRVDTPCGEAVAAEVDLLQKTVEIVRIRVPDGVQLLS